VILTVNFLGSNYPNPFNPTTTIQFGLKQAQNVKITIYNTRGQTVKHLVNGVMPAGTHKIVWDGRDNNNQGIASGMYFYRMETPDYSKTNKAILMK
jgi:flagellar hook assembly protein FlgD